MSRHQFRLKTLFAAMFVACLYLAAWKFLGDEGRFVFVGLVVLSLATVGPLYLLDRPYWR